jgi:cyclopropane fatty-acyl-phospholipid synthase-like methyltransferase
MSRPKRPTPAVFDEAYYARYYENPKTQIYTADEHDALASYVIAFARWNQLALDNILDVGAGIGLWKRWFEKNLPDSRYLGTEVSEAMCARYGYKHCSIAEWRDRKRFDLIVCQGVLQYLTDTEVVSGVANIAAMSRGLVYLEALTQHDYEVRADKSRTDGIVYVRPGSFYRELFAQHFVVIGAGLFWPKSLELPFWELDVAGFPA